MKTKNNRDWSNGTTTKIFRSRYLLYVFPVLSTLFEQGFLLQSTEQHLYW